MIKTTFSVLRATLFCILCTEAVVLSSSVTPAIANPFNRGTEIQDQTSPQPWLSPFLLAFDPPNRGVPGRREGGGTRGGCSEYGTLISLIPVSTMGLTAHEKPELFFYFPVASSDTSIELLLTKLPDSESPDAEEMVIHSTKFKLNVENPGIVGIDLADLDDFPALETDQYYHWYLTILCDQINQAANPVVHGWIQKIDVDSQQMLALQELDVSDRLEFYKEQTLWYDQVAAFSELLSSDPGNVEARDAWLELLRSANLYITSRNRVELYREPFVPGKLVLETKN